MTPDVVEEKGDYRATIVADEYPRRTGHDGHGAVLPA
jgi:hypothetical protein